MELIDQAYRVLLTAAVLILAVLIICSMIRSVLGPRIADRIIAVNMIGTMIIMIIAVLSVYLDENYLVDICLIYAMISFLGVVVLCKVYTGVYLGKKQIPADMEAIEANLDSQTGKGGREDSGNGASGNGESGNGAFGNGESGNGASGNGASGEEA